jgi:hypothetical protein
MFASFISALLDEKAGSTKSEQSAGTLPDGRPVVEEEKWPQYCTLVGTVVRTGTTSLGSYKCSRTTYCHFLVQTKEGKIEAVKVTGWVPAAPLVKEGDQIKVTKIKAGPKQNWEDHELAIEHPVPIGTTGRLVRWVSRSS